MPTFAYVQKFLEENFLDVTISGTSLQAKCAICGDSKKSRKKRRFHLRFDDENNIIFHCFNCDASGSFISLYARIKKISYDDALDQLNSLELIKSRLEDKPKVVRAPNEEPVYYNDILLACIDEKSDITGIVEARYVRELISFRESRQIPENFKLFIAVNGNYKSRIIIPVFDEHDNLLYFQGRRIFPFQEPKYLNPPSAKSLIIPNLNKLKSPVVITEGLLDSFMLGEHGTCALGKNIPDDFIKTLLEKSFEVIVAPDNDTAGVDSLFKLMNESTYAQRVKYFIMPEAYKQYKDLNELKIDNPGINIFDLVLENSHSFTTAQILLRLFMEK